MQVPHGLGPDDPLPDCECWYRLLTNRDHVTRAGTVHYQALKRGAFRPPEGNKRWTHELSGRISSIVTDICADAESVIEAIRRRFDQRGQPVPSKIRFTGVACATAAELRRTGEPAKATDVVYSPLPTDTAHSNFVTYDTVSDDDLDPIRHWLMNVLRVIEPENIETKIDSCGRPPASKD
jgi:hypothetical protein